MTDQRDTHLSRRKVRDRSIVQVLVGTMLFMPPIVGVSQIDARIGGVPVMLLYVFGVWALLIVGAMLLSRRLREQDSPSVSEETVDAEN